MSLSPGKYLYVEASSPAQEGDKARLLSHQFPPTTARCLSFWYHMYGSSTGNLSVYTLAKDFKRTLLWQKAGNQGNQWMQAKVSITSSLDHKVWKCVLTDETFWESCERVKMRELQANQNEQERS